MTESDYWRIVLDRDRRFDGAFVYAVRSTGIYCRPSCASRKPRRERVVFFAGAQQAERAGFRPCRRCRPRAASAPDPQAELVAHICRHLEDADSGQPSLSDLARRFHVSAYHLQRTFKRIAGVTPRQYADACRVKRLKAGIRGGESITGALHAAGYGSSSGLYEHAAEQLGMTPSEYREGGATMKLDYAIAESPLGRLLVAGTNKGICAVYLGDSDRKLEAILKDEFPAAEIRRDGAGLGPWLKALVKYLKGQEPHLDLPLDVRATAFQRRVWEALRAIPYGTTRTYGEIARALGNPGAARAVGRACATNAAALVIPCHRAVRADGELGGYRWGLKRKRRLLELERGTAK